MVRRRAPEQLETPQIPQNLAVLYLRVSGDKQDAENQRGDLNKIAAVRGLDVVHVYQETASAAKHRPAFEAMLADARAGAFGTLVIWALDRFGRSMTGNLQAVLELDSIGVQVVSVKESWLDTTGPVRSLLIAIFSWIAEQERARLIERTQAALDAKRSRNERLGRIPLGFRVAADAVHLEAHEEEQRAIARVRELRAEGLSLRAVVDRMNAEGWKARGKRWHLSTIAKLLS
jgi:DNA invertase Pin-like site-specific DNA recombinase